MQTTNLIDHSVPDTSGPARQRYRADRGGHAPGHLREALMTCLENHECGGTDGFFDALADEDTLSFTDPMWQRHWDKMSVTQRANWLIGQLWNCSDILPSLACQSLDLDAGSTYAVAVRKLRAEMD